MNLPGPICKICKSSGTNQLLFLFLGLLRVLDLKYKFIHSSAYNSILIHFTVSALKFSKLHFYPKLYSFYNLVPTQLTPQLIYFFLN